MTQSVSAEKGKILVESASYAGAENDHDPVIMVFQNFESLDLPIPEERNRAQNLVTYWHQVLSNPLSEIPRKYVLSGVTEKTNYYKG